MSIKVSWQQACQFKVAVEDKFELVVDAEGEGAPCPTDMLLAALGSCSATDVTMALQEQGVDLKGVENCLTYTLTEVSPRLFETINLHFVVTADNVRPEQITEAADNALEKYCHVCLMLQPKIKISHSLEIVAP